MNYLHQLDEHEKEKEKQEREAQKCEKNIT